MNGRERAEKETLGEGPVSSPAEALREAASDQEVLHEDRYDLDAGGSLAVVVCKGADRYRLMLITDFPGPLLLHWGVSRQGRRVWELPPPSMRPQGTVVFDDLAAQTPFTSRGDGLAGLEMGLPADDLPLGVCFVLKDNDTGRWLKDRGQDFYVPVDDSLYRGDAPGDSRLAALADPIISAEMSPNSWTLMHRFNLCHDLLDRVRGDVQGLALLFIWLRYSAIRQLDWHRRQHETQRACPRPGPSHAEACRDLRGRACRARRRPVDVHERGTWGRGTEDTGMRSSRSCTAITSRRSPGTSSRSGTRSFTTTRHRMTS